MSHNLNTKELSRVRALVREHENEIRAAWREHFLSFELFPWFKDAAVSAVLQVESSQAHYLYWPTLDVDLHVDSITHPEKYPLVSKPSA